MADSVVDLEKKLEDLKEQQKQTEATFHQIAGAIMVIQGMIEEQKEKSTDDKKVDKKSA